MPVAYAAPSLTKMEETLLEQIPREITAAEWTQYNALMEKFEDKTLTEEEYEKFIALSDRIEGVEVKRLEYIAELAQQRGLPIVKFMRLYGIKSPSYA